MWQLRSNKLWWFSISTWYGQYGRQCVQGTVAPVRTVAVRGIVSLVLVTGTVLLSPIAYRHQYTYIANILLLSTIDILFLSLTTVVVPSMNQTTT